MTPYHAQGQEIVIMKEAMIILDIEIDIGIVTMIIVGGRNTSIINEIEIDGTETNSVRLYMRLRQEVFKMLNNVCSLAKASISLSITFLFRSSSKFLWLRSITRGRN